MEFQTIIARESNFWDHRIQTQYSFVPPEKKSRPVQRHSGRKVQSPQNLSVPFVICGEACLMSVALRELWHILGSY